MSALILCLAGGCGFELATPENFAKVQSTRAVFRAISPQQDRLLVRHFAVSEKQNLAFWVESLRNHLVEDLGYAVKEDGEFKTEGGLAGHRFLIETAIGEVPYSYEVVVFTVRGWFKQHIYTAELLCAKKNFEKHGPAVDQALLRFRPDRG